MAAGEDKAQAIMPTGHHGLQQEREFRACDLGPPDRVEHVHRAHDVRVEGLARLVERAAHERLGRHVHDDFRLRAGHGVEDRRVVAHVGADVAHGVADACELVQRGGRRHAVGQAADARAERLQPERKPGALEARVAGEQDRAVPPEVRIHERPHDVG
jgi:hypothetical protein